MVAFLNIAIFSFCADSVISRSKTPILSESICGAIVSESVHLNHLFCTKRLCSFLQWHPN